MKEFTLGSLAVLYGLGYGVGLDLYNFAVSGDTAVTLNANSGQSANHAGPTVCVYDKTAVRFNEAYQHHGWRETDTAGTLTAGQNGTVRGDTPLVCVPAMCKTFDARGNGDGETVSTLTGDHENRITDYTSVVIHTMQNTGQGWWNESPVGQTLRTPCGGDSVKANLVVEPIYCLQGNGIDRADTAGCNGKGWKEDTSYTLNTIDRPAVAYLASGKKTVGTLMANAGTKQWLGNQEAFSGDYHIIEESCVRYIVRRLTPTECARLQGFADRWGHPDAKDDFTDAEYDFWLKVRNTHAAINGKAVKEYTKAQMLTWYSKLHTDSSEYKMWGNGIALPPALYCMQGISETLKASVIHD